MKNRKIVFFLLVALVISQLWATAQTVVLKTQDMEDVIDITSFVMNSKGETFLFSRNLLRVFKFKPDGSFEKHFCSRGEGPGEVFRVFHMFYNPANDCLYLPDYVSGGKGHVTIYDSDGNFKGLLKPELSRKYLDRIWSLTFLKNGDYLTETHERVDWKPEGKYFITQEEILVNYFKSDDKLVSQILKTNEIGELSNAVRWGGPAIFFKPDTLINITPDEQFITKTQTDENTIILYDKQGKQVKTITLDIPRRKLTDEAFTKNKKKVLEVFKGKLDSRMYDLMKNMIKLEYRPIFINQFFTSDYIILEDLESRNGDGYIKTSKLVFFDWTGKKKGEKIIDGYIMNVYENKGLILFYDDESNERFKVVPGIFKLEPGSKI